jgi:tight adherence protein B
MFEEIVPCLAIGGAVGLVAYSGGGYFSQVLDFAERDMAEKLKRLQAPTPKLRQYLVAWSAAILMIFLMLWLGVHSLLFAGLAAVFLISAPWYLLRRMAERRRLRIEDQLADAMVTLSSAVKAGLSLAQAMEILADQCPRPISAEFQRIVGEYQMGKPLERTLDEAKQRLQSENFALFAAAIQASRQSGGRLNETIERIAHSVLELQRLERKIMSETAQARKSAVYMALAPLLILFVYYFVDTPNTIKLFTTLPGQILLSISMVLNLIAYLWARFILNPEI